VLFAAIGVFAEHNGGLQGCWAAFPRIEVMVLGLLQSCVFSEHFGEFFYVVPSILVFYTNQPKPSRICSNVDRPKLSCGVAKSCTTCAICASPSGTPGMA
jgi:hypothetical protein